MTSDVFMVTVTYVANCCYTLE